MIWRMAGALVLALVVTAGGAFALARQIVQPAAEGAKPQVFVVESGSTLSRVTRDLESRGLIRSARAAEWLARWQGIASQLRAGEYELSAAWSTAEILEQISSGRVKTYTVVLPEGLRASEIAARLEEAGLADAEAFLELVDDAEFAHTLGLESDGLEGYLYPETYRIARNLPAEQVARILVGEFQNVWREIEPAAAARGLAMHDVVTLASLVEKETGAPDERPLIAGVFLNRLERGMRLETDPSVIYGIDEFDGNLKKRHLLDDSNPYNTYKIRGLPPGPIASPGRDALRAVVEPAETEYLFFVSRGDGTHYFSPTYAEHASAVDRYQRRRRSR